MFVCLSSDYFIPNLCFAAVGLLYWSPFSSLPVLPHINPHYFFSAHNIPLATCETFSHIFWSSNLYKKSSLFHTETNLTTVRELADITTRFYYNIQHVFVIYLNFVYSLLDDTFDWLIIYKWTVEIIFFSVVATWKAALLHWSSVWPSCLHGQLLQVRLRDRVELQHVVEQRSYMTTFVKNIDIIC